jgi:hypothetical protein
MKDPTWDDSDGIFNRALQEEIKNVRMALDLFSKDPHTFSTRHCWTCNRVSILLGNAWGCELEMISERKEKR